MRRVFFVRDATGQAMSTNDNFHPVGGDDCSPDRTERYVREARRVLKPGGRFLFCEHGLAADAAVNRWQRLIELVWKRLAGGCHLTHSVTAAIPAGFKIGNVKMMYLPGTPRVLGRNECGCAQRD